MNANMRPRPESYFIVSTGIFEGKHVDKMSDGAYRLYSWLISRQNWDNGIVYGYTDSEAANALHKSRQTIFKLRQELEGGEYIESVRGQHDTEIKILNAIDPREKRARSKQNFTTNAPDVSPDVKADVNPDVKADVKQLGTNTALISYTQINKLTNSKLTKGDAETASPYQVAEKLSSLCRMDITANKGRLLRVGKNLLSIPGFDPVLMVKTYAKGGSWYRKDFRGSRGDPPTPEQIVATWKVLAESSTPEAGSEERKDYTKWEE